MVCGEVSQRPTHFWPNSIRESRRFQKFLNGGHSSSMGLAVISSIAFPSNWSTGSLTTKSRYWLLPMADEDPAIGNRDKPDLAPPRPRHAPRNGYGHRFVIQCFTGGRRFSSSSTRCNIEPIATSTESSREVKLFTNVAFVFATASMMSFRNDSI